MKRFNPEKELSKIKNGNKNKIILGLCVLLLIVIVGYSFALYQVRHTQKLVFNTVSEFKKRDIYLSVLVDGEYQKEFPEKTDDMLYGGYECDGDSKINFDRDNWQIALYTNHSDKCTIIFGHKYVDQSGANYPELYQGMIPITFKNNKMYIADITSDWYNYDEHRWANAVLIDYENQKSKFYDDNGNLKGGQKITEEDILQMYVWIPRYKYQLFNVNNEETSAHIINVTLENETNNSGDITCTYTNLNNGTIEEKCVKKGTENPAENNDWYTHPAFTFGDTELSGVWIGKFQTSHISKSLSATTKDENADLGCVDINCIEADNIRILPNKYSLRYNNLSNYFYVSRSVEKSENIYGLSGEEIDTHLLRNMEWGATAYLTQSKYGRCQNDGNCEEVSATTTYITGYYGNDKQWNTENGVKASTTGNMYGIYDVAGAGWEYVMANMVDEEGKFSKGLSSFIEPPDSIYYNLYTYNKDYTEKYDRGHLGDATKETTNWYNDYATFATPFFVRGGNSIKEAGIFSFAAETGRNGDGRMAFRVAITKENKKN